MARGGPVAFIDQRMDQIHNRLSLGGFPLISIKAQRRVAADLPDSGNRCQNLQLALPEILIGLLRQILLHPENLGIIKLLLLLPHLYIADFLQLIR